MKNETIEKCYFKISNKGLCFLILYIAILFSAILVTQSTHENRKLLNELYSEKRVYDKAQSEYGRLMLEQSTYTAYSRVESIATSEIKMKVPEPSEIIMVNRNDINFTISDGKDK